jgi:hypothetical protein
MTATRRQTPEGLGEAGRRTWASVADHWALEDHEAETLEQAARTSDLIAALEAEIMVHGVATRTAGGEVKCNPLVIEIRQSRLAVSRMVASLRLTDGQAGTRPQRRSGFKGTYALRPGT